MPLTLAKKQSHDNAHRRKSDAVRGSSTGYQVTNPFFSQSVVQRKPACPCGGSCPRCKGSHVIQTKLKVNEPGDKYEQEADRVADEVMRMTGGQVQDVSKGEEGIRRKCTGCESGHGLCSECAEEETSLQRKAERVSDPVGESVPDGFTQDLGSGQPLDNTTRAFFEPRLGHDLSRVQIHTDRKAAESAQSVNALAYTLGRDVVFGEGQYKPGTATGRRLLAHELAHTVQQNNNNVVRRLTVSPIPTGPFPNPRWTCGEHRRYWKFELANPAPAEGYMVQQIDYSLQLNGCPNRGLGQFNLSETFWEAWRHNSGGKLDAGYINYTDKSERPPDPGKIGKQRVPGVIKFFLKSPTTPGSPATGDLGDVGREPATPNGEWGTKSVPMSAGQPATKTKPSWWDKTPVEGPATRISEVEWRCCGDSSDFNKPYANP